MNPLDPSRQLQGKILFEDLAGQDLPPGKVVVKSLESRTGVYLRFHNETGIDLRCVWINFLGDEVEYSPHIRPGNMKLMYTYCTHPWVFRPKNPADMHLLPFLSINNRTVLFPTNTEHEIYIRLAPSKPWTEKLHGEACQYNPGFASAVRALLLCHHVLATRGQAAVACTPTPAGGSQSGQAEVGKDSAGGSGRQPGPPRGRASSWPGSDSSSQEQGGRKKARVAQGRLSEADVEMRDVADRDGGEPPAPSCMEALVMRFTRSMARAARAAGAVGRPAAAAGAAGAAAAPARAPQPGFWPWSPGSCLGDLPIDLLPIIIRHMSPPIADTEPVLTTQMARRTPDGDHPDFVVQEMGRVVSQKVLASAASQPALKLSKLPTQAALAQMVVESLGRHELPNERLVLEQVALMQGVQPSRLVLPAAQP